MSSKQIHITLEVDVTREKRVDEKLPQPNLSRVETVRTYRVTQMRNAVVLHPEENPFKGALRVGDELTEAQADALAKSAKYEVTITQ